MRMHSNTYTIGRKHQTINNTRARVMEGCDTIYDTTPKSLKSLHTPWAFMRILIIITFNKHINQFKKIWYQNGIHNFFLSCIITDNLNVIFYQSCTIARKNRYYSDLFW